MPKTHISNECDEYDAENKIEEPAHAGEIDEIIIKEGKFKKTITIHERYAARPQCLHGMCLAQFAICYKPGKRKDSWEFVDDVVTQKGSLKLIETEEKLPSQIYLNNGELNQTLGVMSLRTYEAVLRIHNSNKKGRHEEYYSEYNFFIRGERH